MCRFLRGAPQGGGGDDERSVESDALSFTRGDFRPNFPYQKNRLTTRTISNLEFVGTPTN
ncbi:hypothetical protein DLM77_06640 [Leptospira yasudae]|uniref:Uncharacterized protein n=1 Tax=Leptospira yasudae TaxID=2202201 RepID=A0ABX9M4B1_9LEPT|nr:hypothetical protein DLM77_06640 [Leptospira yasudae]